jgi:hypothetical protein
VKLELWKRSEPVNCPMSVGLGGGDEAYYTYVEETDNDANKNSALI